MNNMRKILYRDLINFTEYSDFIHIGWFHRFQFTDDSNRALIETKDGNILSIDREDFKFVNTPEEEMWEQRRYEIVKESYFNNSYGIDVSISNANFIINKLKETQNNKERTND